MKKIDESGYWILKANPISRVGVFEYLGKQIDLDGHMGLEPNRRYNVLRPPEELFAREAIDSFEGIPFINDHTMLGEDFTPVEKMPSHGTVTRVRESLDEPGVLIADVKIYTRTLKDLIEGGKKGLSLGYYCSYEPEMGMFDGRPYEFVQRNLRGNHLALVNRPRNDVYVQDAAIGETVMAIDSAIEEINPMDKKTQAGDAPAEFNAEQELTKLLLGQDPEACKAVLDFLKDYVAKRDGGDAAANADAKPAEDDGAVPPPPPKPRKDDGKDKDADAGEKDAEGDDGEKPADAPAPTPAPAPVAKPDAAKTPADGGEPTDDKTDADAKPAGDCGEVAADCGDAKGKDANPFAKFVKKDAKGKDKLAKDDGETDEDADSDEEDAEGDGGECANPPCGKKGKKPCAQDEAIRRDYFRQFAAAQALAGHVASLTGAFDSAEMSEAEVAVYGCRKLGIAYDEADPASAVFAIRGALKFAHAAKPVTPTLDCVAAAKTDESATQKCVRDYFGE